jgi:hypothetical protein
MLKSS